MVLGETTTTMKPVLDLSTNSVNRNTATRYIARSNRRSPARNSGWIRQISWLGIERVCFGVGVLFALWVLVFASVPTADTTKSGSRTVSTVMVTVVPGDTVWSLASSSGLPTASAEDRLSQVADLNPGLDMNRPLVPGMLLRIPVSAAAREDTRVYLAGSR